MIVMRALLEELFSSFSLPLPDQFKIPDFMALDRGNTLPSDLIEEEVAYICAFVLCAGIPIFAANLALATFPDDGRAHSSESLLPTMGESQNGWVKVETVLVRLNELSAPNASFPVWDVDEFGNRIGYDAVVCVEMYEPWIVQIYNSGLGVPTTMNIVGKSASTDFETDYGNKGPYLDSYTRALNSTGKDAAFYVGYVGSFAFERC